MRWRCLFGHKWEFVARTPILMGIVFCGEPTTPGVMFAYRCERCGRNKTTTEIMDWEVAEKHDLKGNH